MMGPLGTDKYRNCKGFPRSLTLLRAQDEISGVVHYGEAINDTMRFVTLGSMLQYNATNCNGFYNNWSEGGNFDVVQCCI